MTSCPLLTLLFGLTIAPEARASEASEEATQTSASELSWGSRSSPLDPLLLSSKPHPGKKKPKGKKKKKAPEPHWVKQFYWRPSGGVVVYGDGESSTTAATAGAEAGWAYRLVDAPPPPWSGRARGKASLTYASSGTVGLDLRAGNFIGPSYGDLDLQLGTDLFWNQLTLSDGSTQEPTVGLEMPLTAMVSVQGLSAWAGLGPAWVANEDRRVNWDEVDAFGFGHEFFYMAGFGTELMGTWVSGSYSYRIQSTGIQQGFSFSAKI